MKFQMHHITNLAIIALVVAISACTSENRDANQSDTQDAKTIAPVQEAATKAPVVEDPVFKAGQPVPRPDECCTDPGAISVCWWQDAENDGVTCQADADCPNNTECVKTGLPGLESPDGSGLCACDDASDCGDDGVCNTDTNLCGPSFCNGYRVCSCFGGCIDYDPGDPYDNPSEVCAAITGAGNCCEGVYPDIPGTNLTGYCSDDPSCANDGCTDDGDCVDDGNVCTTEECDESTGGCETTFNTLPCDDGNACTEDDTCDLGSCVGTALDCDDGNICTEDTCDEVTGCVNDGAPNNGDSCEDGDACTTPDVCLDGACDPGPPRDCDDSNVCTDDDCDSADFATPCFYTNNTDSCDDGDDCTEPDVCAGGSCSSGAGVDCNDSNVCTTDSCNSSGGCEYVNNTNACDDGDECTSPDVCAGGSCGSGPAVNCDDSNICTDDSCIPASGCAYANNTDPCDDGDECTEPDLCSGGSCSAGAAVDCDDSDDCTTDSCDINGDCVNAVIASCCEVDGDCDDFCGCDGSNCVDECVDTSCVANECVCDETYGFDNSSVCTWDTLTYPENCYEGECDINGLCAVAALPSSGNNMCRGSFQAGDPTALDTASSAYMGSFTNSDSDQPMLAISGSTECGTDNYEATGNNCEEFAGAVASNMGYGGADMVYSFEYQTNGADQYQLYSYLIKVEADFNVGIYIKSDIDEADECPEGTNDDDSNAYTVKSARCFFPYIGSSAVIEDECVDGNAATGAGCCNANPFTDPFTSEVDPVTCSGTAGALDKGYYWCRRYYPAGCCTYAQDEDCQNAAGCEGYWEYPQDPHDCDFEQDTYPYNNVATAIISPEGAVDGTMRKAFIFVDGVSSIGDTEGNFYLTVQRRAWQAGPCDRANDDIRLFDVTNAGYTTSVYTGNLESAVNDTHLGGGACGGYTCNNSMWLGGSSCHETNNFQSNEFWPNNEYVKIDRPMGAGDETYCFETDEAGATMGDMVLTAIEMTSQDSICSGWSNELACVHDDYVDGAGVTNFAPGNGNIRIEFEAAEGSTYIVGLSNWEDRDSPCGTEVGDTCNYSLSVTEGGCSTDCDAPLETEQGSFTATVANYGLETDTGTVNDTHGNHWASSCRANAFDQAWIVENQTSGPLEMTFTQTPTSGQSGAIALYDCKNVELDCSNNGSGSAADSLTYTLLPDTEYYLVVEARNTSNTSDAGYNLEVAWGSLPVCGDPTSWPSAYNGDIVGAVSLNGLVATPNNITGDSCSATPTGSFESYGSGYDVMWQIDVVANGTVDVSGCPADGYGANYDTKFRLYDCEGTQISSNDDGCAGVDSLLSGVSFDTNFEPYFLVVDAFSSLGCGLYDIGIGSGVTCGDPTTWDTPYLGDIAATVVNVNGSTVTPTSVSGSTCTAVPAGDYHSLSNGYDVMYQIDVDSAANLDFNGCAADGYGASKDTEIGLYDCMGTLITSADGGCLGDFFDSFMGGVDLDTTVEPYFLLVDQIYTAECGTYDIGIYDDVAPDTVELLVVADEAAGAADMSTAITSLGHNPTQINVSTFTGMSVVALQAYDAVFYAGDCSLSAQQSKAMDYMDAGGSFFIADNDVGFANSGTTIFYKDYLEANYVADSSNDSAPVGQSIMAGINPSIASDPWPDNFSTRPGAVKIFNYTTANAAGVSVDQLGYKAIYLAFDFANVASSTDQQDIIEAALDFFGTGGAPPPTGDLPYTEDFSSWVPTDWTIEDGGESTDTWKHCPLPISNCNEGGFTLADGAFALVNSDDAASGSWLQEGLISPTLDLSTYTAVQLEFDYGLSVSGGGDYGAVQVSIDGAAFTTLATYNTGTDAVGVHVLLDISAAAAGESDVRIRFYYDDNDIWAWYWLVDSIEITGS